MLIKKINADHLRSIYAVCLGGFKNAEFEIWSARELLVGQQTGLEAPEGKAGR